MPEVIDQPLFTKEQRRRLEVAKEARILLAALMGPANPEDVIHLSEWILGGGNNGR